MLQATLSSWGFRLLPPFCVTAWELPLQQPFVKLPFYVFVVWEALAHLPGRQVLLQLMQPSCVSAAWALVLLESGPRLPLLADWRQQPMWGFLRVCRLGGVC